MKGWIPTPERKVLRVVEPLDKYRPFHSNTCRHSQGRIFPFYLSRYFFVSPRCPPPGSRGRGHSIVSLQRRGWRRLTCSSAPRAHPLLAPATPWRKAFLSPALCKHFPFSPLSIQCVFDSGGTLGKCTDAPGWESESQWEEPVRDWQWLTQHAPVSCKLAFDARRIHSVCVFSVSAPADPSGKRLPDVKRTRCDERQMLWCKHIIVVKERLAQWRFKGGIVHLFCWFPPPPPPQFWF